MSCASHVLCQSISFNGRSTNASNKRHAEVAKAASAFNMHTAYSTPDTNGIIINSFAFYPASVGVQCALPVAKCIFICIVRHCLQEVHFVWCIERDQFETENIAEADMKQPPKQQSAASLMLYLSSQSFSIVVCLVVVCT